MIKKFALLNKEMAVVGTLNIPEGTGLETPHHVPHILLGDDEKVEDGMVYDTDRKKFITPEESRTITITPIIPTQEEEQRAFSDPPLPEGKRYSFPFFRKKK